MPNQPAQTCDKWSRWFRPSLGDCLVIAVLLWPIVMTVIGADAGLLLDSATGCHIRTGDYIIDHASVPHVDPFSFTKNGQAWFAWEWLADLLFARIFGILGMQGLVVTCALLIAATAFCAVRHSLWGGADALTTLVLFQLWVGASSIHFLARPHLFTLLFLALSLWLIDSDRRRSTPRLWLLVPLTVLWANLHGGFVALVVSLVIIAIGSAVEALLSSTEASRQAWRAAMRYSLIAGSCLAASAINPYGVAEHRHLISYLSADWIKDLVEEFQSPRFQANGMFYFEVLLIVGILVAARLAAKREIASALLVLAWAHASLISVRHIPVFAIVCLPLAGRELTALRDRWIESGTWTSLAKVFRSLGSDHAPGLARLSLWAAVPVLALLAYPIGPQRFSFPETKFPKSFVERNAGLISQSRTFTLDSWADYLTYRFYPHQRIFIDGRSDFFGKDLSEQYLQLLNGRPGWADVLRRHNVEVVFVPAQSATASLLRLREDWTLVDEADGAALFRQIRNRPVVSSYLPK
jgi:hypothetical protein